MFLKFLQFLAIGHTCPRKALINSPVQLLKQIDQRALENINFSEEYNHAKAQITQETHR